MMDYPKLRPIEAIPFSHRGQQMILLRDPLQISQREVRVSPTTMMILSLFDGEHSIRDIQNDFARRTGRLLFTHEIQQLVVQMDECLLLESDHFAAHRQQLLEDYRQQPARPAMHAGSAYAAEPEALREMLDGFFQTARKGAPEPPLPESPVVGLIVPHIDFHRGGVCLAHGYAALEATCEAELFIVLGVSHFGEGAYFTATTKDFDTPLGTVRTDRAFVEDLARRYHGQSAKGAGPSVTAADAVRPAPCAPRPAEEDLLADELTHRSEHSIEFQAVFLQYLFGGRRTFQIVPILCGSFHPLYGTDTRPEEVPAIGDFFAALRETIAASGKRTAVIAGADLAHVGRFFNTPEALTPGYLRWVEGEDRRLLERAAALDRPGFFAAIEKDNNRRNVCSVAAIYTLLSVLDAQPGRLLKYEQAVDYPLQRVVTFASLAFPAAGSPYQTPGPGIP